jgi:uncharacterized membrane protein YhaH (DUF805 family)
MANSLSLTKKLDRLPYLLIGVTLAVIKFAVDRTIATQVFEQPWSPLNYLIWPADHVASVFELHGPERTFSLVMMAVALPFVWTGVVLTVQRLRAADLPPALVLLFFVPLINLFLFLLLILLPSRQATASSDRQDDGILDVISIEPLATTNQAMTGRVANQFQSPANSLQKMHSSLVRDSQWRSGLVALSITVPLMLLVLVVGAQVFQSYGFSVFIGSPFAVGLISVLIFGYSQPKPLAACLGVAFATATVLGIAVLLVAIEGLICLLMAAPIAYVLVLLGALVGYVIQLRGWLSERAPTVTAALLLALPLIMAAEWSSEPEPVVRKLTTETIVNASPAEVWNKVVSFPPLAEPDEWLFQSGIAYPQCAEIHGHGVGARRHCIFSTGAFIEPIEIWDEPSLLRFSVTEQPEPMHELSPYHIHPAHLNHYLCSRRGQFLLEALPDGRTKLSGTTWYSNRMWPAPYWGLWSDYIIHRIHTRVLNHIKSLADAGATE